MKFRSLEYFVQVADEGSITRTADKLGVPQPVLTRHVQQLETELGTRLLLRLPRGVRLTASGRDFLDHARRIVLDIARAKERVRGVAKTPRGRVVLGTSPTLAPLLLPGCVARALQQCPLVTMKVTEVFSAQLLDALLTGRLDLAVMTNPPRSRSLALTPLISEPLVVLSPQGARGSARPLSLTELSRTPFIVTDGIRTVVDEELAGFGTALRIEAEVDSVETIRRLLAAGTGMTIMPVSAFHAEIASGKFAVHAIEGANLHRILVLARPVAESRSAAIDEIEHIVRAEMAALLEAGLFSIPAPRSVQGARKRRPPAKAGRRGQGKPARVAGR